MPTSPVPPITPRRRRQKFTKVYDFCAPVPCGTPPVRNLSDPCNPCSTVPDKHCIGGSSNGHMLMENDCCSECGQVGGGCGCEAPSSARMVMSCPAGTVPKYPQELYIARSPGFDDIFSCFKNETLYDLFQQYVCYKLCGCNGALSLVLATAHFVTLFEIVQLNVNGATYVMASKGSSVMPIEISSPLSRVEISDYHWVQTTFGMAYRDLKQNMVYRVGMAVCL